MNFADIKQKTTTSIEDRQITDNPQFDNLLNELVCEFNKGADGFATDHLIVKLEGDYDYDFITKVMHNLGYRVSAKVVRDKNNVEKTFHAWSIQHYK